MCPERAELDISVSLFHWAAEPKTQVWLWLQQVSDRTPACRVLHSPGMLRRCPVPTWGRIPISRISWYLRSRRSFSGGRLLPACSRRSGPSPGASSPASSLTFCFVTHTALRETETDESRMTAWRHWLVTLLPPAPEGYMREERSSSVACFSPGFFFFFISRILCFLLHVTSYETHVQTLRGAAPAPSAPKHRLPVDAQEHVNSPKV